MLFFRLLFFVFLHPLFQIQMETQNTSDSNPKAPKRGTIFLIAILIGLLFGVVATLLILNIVGPRHTSSVHVIPMDTTALKSKTDTVVQYVIHKYEPGDYQGGANQKSDTISSDSTTYAYDETEDLTMDYDEMYLPNDYSGENVTAEKLLEKLSLKVVFLDQNKVECAAPEHSSNQIILQVWESLIKNKLTYHYYGNLLKVKGLKPEHTKIVHYKNNYYLVNNHHVYPIHHNSQFERLVETHEVVF